MRRVLIWLVALGLLGGGAYVGDNLLRGYAEDQAAAQIEAELGEAEGLEISLGGAPFSLALITRSVPSSVLTADAVPIDVDGHQVSLTEVNVTTGMIALDETELQVTNLSGAAVLGYADLEQLAGVPVGYAEGGRLELRYATSVLGKEVSLAVSALPVLDVAAASIRLTDPALDVNGSEFDLPVEQRLIDSLVEPIDLSLDYGLQVTAITPTTAGLSLAVSGAEVAIPLR